MILSVGMLMRWIGKHRAQAALIAAADAIDAAVDTGLADRATRTADLGGTMSCRAFGARVADALGSRLLHADPISG